MFIIYVFAIICGVLFHVDIWSSMLVFIISGVIALRKQLLHHFFYSFVLMILSFFHLNDYFQIEKGPFLYNQQTKLTQTMKSQWVRFNDDLLINGDQFKGTFQMQNKTYQFYYYIHDEQTIDTLKKQLPFMKSCQVGFNDSEVLPNTNHDGFDYRKYLLQNHIDGIVKVTNFDLTQCKSIPLNLHDSILKYRSNMIEKINVLPFKYKDYFIALTVGDTKYLSSEALYQLKLLGIYHLYAVSGSHVSIISVVLYYCLKRCYVPIWVSKSIVLGILPCFILLTGAAPSVLRAALFIMIVLSLYQYRISLLSCLSISFILNWLMDAKVVLDIGFQLSYLISYAFIVLMHMLNNKPFFISLLISTCISQVVTMPLILYHFNSIYFIGMLTNLIFVPLFSVLIFPLAICILLYLMIFNHMPQLFIHLFDLCFEINMTLTHWFMAFPNLEWIVGFQPKIVYVLMTFFILMMFHKKYHRYFTVLFIMMVVLIEMRSGNERIHFLDVNQGDSTVIESHHQVMIIDTGGKMAFNQHKIQRHKENTLADQSIIPFLKYHQLRNIDYLLITHPDFDHFGEAERLIQHFYVKHLILKRNSQHVHKYDSLLRLAEKFHVKIIDAETIKAIHLNNMSIELLNTSVNHEDENEESIILNLKHQNNHSFLFMGDLGQEGEHKVIESLNKSILGIKIGHHGSKTSTSDALLDHFLPKVAIISAGRNNRFGHPHNETVDKLNQRNINILDTRIHGRISYDFKKGWSNRLQE